jgi:hypothetical protein
MLKIFNEAWWYRCTTACPERESIHRFTRLAVRMPTLKQRTGPTCVVARGAATMTTWNTLRSCFNAGD